MSFAIYLAGFIIFTGGVAWALSAAHVAPLYILITALILLGLGIMAAVSKTRAKDISH